MADVDTVLHWEESRDALGVWWAWPEDQDNFQDAGELELSVWENRGVWCWEVLDGDAGSIIGLDGECDTKLEAMLVAEAAAKSEAARA